MRKFCNSWGDQISLEETPEGLRVVTTYVDGLVYDRVLEWPERDGAGVASYALWHNLTPL